VKFLSGHRLRLNITTRFYLIAPTVQFSLRGREVETESEEAFGYTA